MQIVGRTAGDCFERFRAHVASLVKATISGDCPVLVRERDGRNVLSFYRGDPVTIPLKTRSGTLHFYLGQHLEAIEEGRSRFRLRTK